VSRFPAVAAFLAIAVFAMSINADVVVNMTQCSAHGIRPHSSTVFCRSCGAMHDEETETCSCGSSALALMCDLCDLHFRRNGGRVPVETAN
jgi:hypothetical protein